MSEQTYEAIGELITALKFKKAGGDRKWETEDAKYFRRLVQHWDSELVAEVATRVEFHEEWRPDAARRCSRRAQPAPTTRPSPSAPRGVLSR